MNKQQLLEEISKTLNKIKANDLAQIAAENDFSIQDLLMLCYHPDKQIAFRASWILEFIEQGHPDKFISVLQYFLIKLPQQKNDSCQRHFSKILMHLTMPKAKNISKVAFEAVPDTLKEQVVETMFAWLIEPSTPVAVKVNCMEVLFYMIPLYPWIKDELVDQIIFYMKDGSAAMQSRGKKILNKIQSP